MRNPHLTDDEERAFVAFFHGAHSHVTKFDDRPDVFFGKAECGWVDFEDFWLKKLPSLGWIKVELLKRVRCKGMVGQPMANKYKIAVTDEGVKAYKRITAWEL